MIFKISDEKIEEFIEEQHSIDGMVSMHDFELWLEEQPRVGEWKKTAEEKPDYTRHVIITYGSSRHASKYGYYFKKEDKWYRDHRCIEEIEPPYAWTEMPEVPDEFICGVCCG